MPYVNQIIDEQEIRLLSVHDAARICGLSPWFFYDKSKSGLPGLYKCGRFLRVNLPEFLEACKTEKPGNGEAASHEQQ